jgi:hypothetical protein
MFDFFRKWIVRSDGGSLLDVVERFLREEEHLAPARDVDGTAVRARVTLDGIEFSLVVVVQGSVLLCICIASEPTPDDARDRVSRYLTRANVVQQFACLAMSSDAALRAHRDRHRRHPRHEAFAQSGRERVPAPGREVSPHRAPGGARRDRA